MEAPSSSLLSDASSAPPAQNEPVIQEDQHNDKTAEEKELAAAQQRIDALPMLKILSIIRKALPADAHIDADVDELIRTCVAKFAGILTKVAKQQQTLARHKVMQSEDIINVLKQLGFEDSSTALSLFFSRFRVATNHSQPIQTEMQQKGNINVPNQGNATEPLPTEMQRQGSVDIPTGTTFGPNQGITHGDPTSSLQYWGNSTMLPPPSPALPSWPASYTQAGSASFLNAPPVTQPMNQPALPGYMQMASQQQNVGGYGTTMPADGTLCGGAGNTSDSLFGEEMTEEDLAYVLELLRD